MNVELEEVPPTTANSGRKLRRTLHNLVKSSKHDRHFESKQLEMMVSDEPDALLLDF